jgi:hypothetical protein
MNPHSALVEENLFDSHFSPAMKAKDFYPRGLYKF